MSTFTGDVDLKKFGKMNLHLDIHNPAIGFIINGKSQWMDFDQARVFARYILKEVGEIEYKVD